MTTKRKYEIVLFGATGFTGELTARYLAEAIGKKHIAWAIAGRNKNKLNTVKERLKNINPAAGSRLAVVVADVDERQSLKAMAEQTRVLITTVGPYIEYGEPVLAACAAAGTDYLDLTGEPEFVDMAIRKYDAVARNSGARIINCCGFDSIPHDLGALFTVKQLPAGKPIRLEGFVRAGGTFSGGTWQSAITAFSRWRAYSKQRRSMPKPEVQGDRKVGSMPLKIRYENRLLSWVCPFPTIDPEVVKRSARALEDYGPDFKYGHYVQVKKLPVLIGGLTAVGGIFAAAQLKPTRKLLQKVKGSGEGPSKEEREKGWFKVRFIGTANGETVVTEVSGGDPGYSETAKMLGESALCLVRDKLPKRAGVITPAVAMGETLIERLQAAGITFKVVD